MEPPRCPWELLLFFSLKNVQLLERLTTISFVHCILFFLWVTCSTQVILSLVSLKISVLQSSRQRTKRMSEWVTEFSWLFASRYSCLCSDCGGQYKERYDGASGHRHYCHRRSPAPSSSSPASGPRLAWRHSDTVWACVWVDGGTVRRWVLIPSILGLIK